MKENSKEIKQIIILGVVLILVIVFSVVMNNILNSDTETSETTDETVEGTETEYTINGYTKEEWENSKSYTDETIYNIVMELFEHEENFSENSNLEVDLNDLIEEDEEGSDYISEEEQDEIETEVEEFLQSLE